MDEIFGGNRVKYKYPKNTQRCDANSILNVLSTAFAKQQKYYSAKKIKMRLCALVACLRTHDETKKIVKTSTFAVL